MNKFIVSFHRVFKEELLKIQKDDERKSESIDKELVVKILDEERVVRSAKSYVQRHEPESA